MGVFKGTKGYVLQFGKDFKPGMNSVDDVGISVAIILDVSGSMGDPPRSGGRSQVPPGLEGLRDDHELPRRTHRRQKDLKVQVTLLKFSNGVDTVLPMTELNAEGIEKLKLCSSPENFRPDGGTAIGAALEAGAEALAQSGTIFNSLIIITDGENNNDPDPLGVMDAIYANRNMPRPPRIRVIDFDPARQLRRLRRHSPQFEDIPRAGRQDQLPPTARQN